MLADEPGEHGLLLRRHAQAGDVARREVFERTRREHEEEVRLERVPVDLANARDRRGDRLARDRELEFVADPEARLHCDFLLDRDERRATIVGHPPLALQYLVAVRQLGGPRQVLLAAREPLSALVRVLEFLDRGAVDRRHARAHERIEARHGDVLGAKDVRNRLAFVGLDVDHEVIRRVLVERLAPAFEQVCPHQRQEEQDRNAEAERNDLYGARPSAPRNVGEPVAPRDADPGAESAHRRDQSAANEIQRQRDHDDAAEQNREHARVADRVVEQCRDRGERQPRNEQARRRRRLGVVAQHAQRRRVLELQERRQGKTDEQHHRAARCEQHRLEPRIGQVALDQVSEDDRQCALRNEAAQAAEHNPDRAECDELQHGHDDDERLRCAEALHERHRVHAPMRESARRHRYCDGRQQQADHGR